jgi:short subunit dehydrogenase-like uncharacterized protein
MVILGDGEGPEGSAVQARCTVTAEEDPGYGATARMLAEAALRLAETAGATQDVEGGPLASGVLTPASAFGMPLVERLGRAGISFETELV